MLVGPSYNAASGSSATVRQRIDLTASFMRIVITGGSGFIGRRLVRHLLARKDLVTVLSRDPVESRGLLPESVRVAGYTPNEEGPWFEELARTDAVVSLSGAPVVGVRWSALSSS